MHGLWLIGPAANGISTPLKPTLPQKPLLANVNELPDTILVDPLACFAPH